MTELEKDLENICFDEQDIKTQIQIIEKTLELYEREISYNDVLDQDHIDSLRKNLIKEELALEKMKDKYPEYFI